LLENTKKLSDLEPNLLKHFLKTKDLHEHRKESSGIFKLSKIETPLLILKAENDNLCEIDDQFILDLKKPNIYLGTTKYGGHIGFYEKYFD